MEDRASLDKMRKKERSGGQFVSLFPFLYKSGDRFSIRLSIALRKRKHNTTLKRLLERSVASPRQAPHFQQINGVQYSPFAINTQQIKAERKKKEGLLSRQILQVCRIIVNQKENKMKLPLMSAILYFNE